MRSGQLGRSESNDANQRPLASRTFFILNNAFSALPYNDQILHLQSTRENTEEKYRFMKDRIHKIDWISR